MPQGLDGGRLNIATTALGGPNSASILQKYIKERKLLGKVCLISKFTI